jgi:hypothetical protein
MVFTPWLPTELWLIVFQLAASYPSPSISPVYVPFETPGILLALEEKLQARRSLVLVCKLWRTLATELLYEDVRIKPGTIYLKQSSVQGDGDGDSEDVYGKFVRRAVLPYDLTATDRPQPIPALDILRRCSRLETLVRPRRAHMDNLRWEFSAPSLTLCGLKRLDWWHYNDAARSGGINSFHHVLQLTPNLRYLSIGGDLWITFSGAAPIHLPSLTTLRLGRMNMLFVHQICRWSLPSLTHLILDSSYGRGMEPLWKAFGANLQVVELGSDLRFAMEDHIAIILPKCPNLIQFNYYVMFTSKSTYSGLHPTITSIGLHCHPCGLFQDGDQVAVEHIIAHLSIVSSATFPGLQRLFLYGDWKPFRSFPEFLDMETTISMEGVAIVHEQNL